MELHPFPRDHIYNPKEKHSGKIELAIKNCPLQHFLICSVIKVYKVIWSQIESIIHYSNLLVLCMAEYN